VPIVVIGDYARQEVYHPWEVEIRVLGFLREVAQGGHIAVVSHAGNDSESDARDERFVSKILASVDVREVNFYGL
jgi:hypothetical protein